MVCAHHRAAGFEHCEASFPKSAQSERDNFVGRCRHRSNGSRCRSDIADDATQEMKLHQGIWSLLHCNKALFDIGDSDVSLGWIGKGPHISCDMYRGELPRMRDVACIARRSARPCRCLLLHDLRAGTISHRSFQRSPFATMTRTYPLGRASVRSFNGPAESPSAPPSQPATGVVPIKNPVDFAQPFCDFLTRNPTVFHAVDAVASDLKKAGYSKLSERDTWSLQKGGKYYLERNGSSLIAFVVGKDYQPGNGVAMIAGHVDALTAKLKPISRLDTKAGFVQLGMCLDAVSCSADRPFRRRSVCWCAQLDLVGQRSGHRRPRYCQGSHWETPRQADQHQRTEYASVTRATWATLTSEHSRTHSDARPTLWRHCQPSIQSRNAGCAYCWVGQ